jgi:hypothetical protein
VNRKLTNPASLLGFVPACDSPLVHFREVNGNTEVLPGIHLLETSGYVTGHQVCFCIFRTRDYGITPRGRVRRARRGAGEEKVMVQAPRSVEKSVASAPTRARNRGFPHISGTSHSSGLGALSFRRSFAALCRKGLGFDVPTQKA